VKLAGDDALLEAFANSLTIAFVAMLASVVLGTMAGIALWRFRFTGRGLFDGMITLPIVVPEICMGVGMLVFFGSVFPWPRDLVWPLDLGAIMIAHITFCFPFVTVVVRAPCQLQPRNGGGRPRSGRIGRARAGGCDAAAPAPGADFGRAAGLHHEP
jgi:ABC-type spermidine/putrescine transport system permease subunit II